MTEPEQTILVVEDDEMIQAFLALHLENEGYAVQTTACGLDMIQSLSEKAPDLILMDLNLPDNDGLSLTRQVRLTSTVPIIIATTRQSREDRLMGLGLGADDYVTKPFDPRELLLRVRNILERTLPEGVSLPAPSQRPLADTGREIPAALLPAPVPETDGKTERRIGLRPAMVIFTSALAAAGAAVTAYWLLATPVPAPSPVQATAQNSKPAQQKAPVVTSPVLDAAPNKTVTVTSTPTPRTAIILSDVPPAWPMSKVLGPGWAFNSQCASVPQVKWWQFKTHASIAAFVNRRHAGDWKRYMKIWLNRVAKLQDIYERQSSAVTRTGLVLKGEALNTYLRQMQKRIAVIHCLAGEAGAHAAAKVRKAQ